MTNPAEKNFTGEYISYPNGNVFAIYSQVVKSGVRFYRYRRGLFNIIGRTEIEQRIYTQK